MIKAPKKLIEVALPLDVINEAAVNEKKIKVGKPTSVHHWWARRPMTPARALIFSQLVNDPGGERGWGKYPGQTKEDAARERERLFDIIRNLVRWKSDDQEQILQIANKEILKSWNETNLIEGNKSSTGSKKLPPFLDPFSGGGSLPLEAQRLGLESYASDLNPIAVMITKSLIEIPPKFSDHQPICLSAGNSTIRNLQKIRQSWPGTTALVKDILYYGNAVRDDAYNEIGHLYPEIEITKEMAENRNSIKPLIGHKFPVVAWIWARTVKSPNPALDGIEVPLISTFILSSKKGKRVWLKPKVKNQSYSFQIKTGDYPDSIKNGTKLSRGANFRCILSNTSIPPDYIKSEGKAGRIGKKLIAVVADGRRSRLYLPATNTEEKIALNLETKWKPKGSIPEKLTGGTCYGYGYDQWYKIFTDRQLLGLTTFSDKISQIRRRIILDAIKSGMADDGIGLQDGGSGATAYGDAISVYLALIISRVADWNNSLSRWESKANVPQQLFGRQAIPMIWDFAEANIFSKSTGSFLASLKNLTRALSSLSPNQNNTGYSLQDNAIKPQYKHHGMIVSTDPPYYDNIGYSDLSDFYYVWIRKILKPIFPNLFGTISVPKDEELVASQARRGGKDEAEKFFIDGMKKALIRLHQCMHDAYPLTIYYAFKQDANTASKGWEAFLEAVIQAGFTITATWPIRTEMASRMISQGTNALASSVILACRKRVQVAQDISRRQFLRELKETLPEALDTMIGGKEGTSPIAPVDLAQATIGPGMAVYSKYSSILEADGSPMSVHDALVQINREIDDYFNAAEGDLDPDSRFCIDWFQQYGFKTGAFGEADIVARAKGTSVDAASISGVIRSGGGKVQLLTYSDYPKEWNPDKDPNIPIWEATHQLIRALRGGGEKESGFLLSRLPGKIEQIRQLAYRLYTLCERQGWAEEARTYNELISSWHSIVSASEDVGVKGEQMDLF